MDRADHLGESVTAAGVKALLIIAGFLLIQASVAVAEDGEIVQPPSRDVTPPGATQGPATDGPLIREKVPPPPPDPPRWRRFFLPTTTDAATFKTDKLTIRVSGVSPPASDQTCRKADGEEWPCGRTALFSLRLFLRGRAIECFFPRPEGIEEVVAPCRVGKTDLGRWLISEGWATPDENATDEYRSLAAAAKCGGKGQWRGNAKPDDCQPAGQ
jgi:endonuclease YncB( thermonuclease family)